MNPITVSAEIKQDLSKVWKFFNEPEHITKWNFAIPEWHCPSASNDLKVGGTLKYRIEAKDGSMGFDFSAVYKRVDHEKLLEFILADGRNVVVNFTDMGAATLVTETFDPETENPVELQRGGWQSILNNFKQYAESN